MKVTESCQKIAKIKIDKTTTAMWHSGPKLQNPIEEGELSFNDGKTESCFCSSSVIKNFQYV